MIYTNTIKFSQNTRGIKIKFYFKPVYNHCAIIHELVHTLSVSQTCVPEDGDLEVVAHGGRANPPSPPGYEEPVRCHVDEIRGFFQVQLY